MNILKSFFNKISKTKMELDELFFDELEEVLIEADTGVISTQLILNHIKKISRQDRITNSQKLKTILKNHLKELIVEGQLLNTEGLKLIIFTGINDVGKTTSLAKLAYYLIQKKNNIKIVAADTFRAGAIDQLVVWANRIKVPIIKTDSGADSGAVVYDGITSALNDNTDYLIIDTAGRMHTSNDLMQELKKIKNICLKRIQENNIETILVIDSTTGQNGFIQAETFNQYIPLTGLFLSKYDSIFKGGIIIRISNELKIPIKFIGTGEALSDIEIFNKNTFIESLGL